MVALFNDPNNIIPINAVAAGGSHALAIDGQGKIWAWGNNTYGQLGVGAPLERQYIPQPVQGQLLAEEKIIHVGAGRNHSACATYDGDIYTWGDGSTGCLGTPFFGIQPEPVRLETAEVASHIFCKASCGPEHTVMVTKFGDIFTCGVGAYGRLGHASVTNEVELRKVGTL